MAYRTLGNSVPHVKSCFLAGMVGMGLLKCTDATGNENCHIDVGLFAVSSPASEHLSYCNFKRWAVARGINICLCIQFTLSFWIRSQDVSFSLICDTSSRFVGK